jgi:hypothetical protein
LGVNKKWNALGISTILVGGRDLWPLWSPLVSLNLVCVLETFNFFIFLDFYVFSIIIIILWSSNRTNISSIALIGTDSS